MQKKKRAIFLWKFLCKWIKMYNIHFCNVKCGHNNIKKKIKFKIGVIFILFTYVIKKRISNLVIELMRKEKCDMWHLDRNWNGSLPYMTKHIFMWRNRICVTLARGWLTTQIRLSAEKTFNMIKKEYDFVIFCTFLVPSLFLLVNSLLVVW